MRQSIRRHRHEKVKTRTRTKTRILRTFRNHRRRGQWRNKDKGSNRSLLIINKYHHNLLAVRTLLIDPIVVWSQACVTTSLLRTYHHLRDRRLTNPLFCSTDVAFRSIGLTCGDLSVIFPSVDNASSANFRGNL